jgi:hypothetical protein
MKLEIQNFIKDKNNRLENNGKNKVEKEEHINRELTR